MPSLGADMEGGTVVEWLVHPGDAVHRARLLSLRLRAGDPCAAALLDGLGYAPGMQVLRELAQRPRMFRLAYGKAADESAADPV